MRFLRKRQTTGHQPTQRTATVIAVCLALSAGATESGHAAAQAAAKKPWRPAACPPVAERGTGPSSIKVTGPCAFEHKGEAECDAEYDDFLVKVFRPAKNSAQMMLLINVERYVGPRTYKGHNDMIVSLKDGSKIYRWSTAEYEVTVGPGSKSVTVKNVRLEPEPVLVGCTGPQDNFQCDGRGDDDELLSSLSTVSGTLYCKAGGAKRR
jgi:hypothetical protein